MTALSCSPSTSATCSSSDLVVVAPDAGRVKLTKKFADKIGAELAILDKERPAQQVAEIGYVIGDVKGKTAVIVDDIIDTAGTLRGRRARPSWTRAPRASTPPRRTPSSPATPTRTSRLAVRAASSSPTRSRCAPARRTTSRCSRCADLLTDSIRRIFTDDSVSEVFGGENQLF